MKGWVTITDWTVNPYGDRRGYFIGGVSNEGNCSGFWLHEEWGVFITDADVVDGAPHLHRSEAEDLAKAARANHHPCEVWEYDTPEFWEHLKILAVKVAIS